MPEKTTIKIEIDRGVKEEAEAVLAGIGLDIATATRMLLRQVVVDNGLPFRSHLDDDHHIDLNN
ncbi:MAG: type II toxin-antitoxin system RelB/DinJ family antitoxin [Candidatus Paralactobacillus gallistercoris]|uniref:Type II toxin-antitoxin system RelB/DinJ family antitoxin n=1 Tax=Candidatus Paralactobacillus gallistercoris TaxID=2838724 RepID=A0A948TJK7_9LACO|nr:type II toxin-antitoxin system RelB/DinJ family antitoxin [Candidatus Paralactobacillus gallistercoris]